MQMVYKYKEDKMKLRKMLSLVLAVVLTVGLLPSTVMAKETVSSPRCSLNPEINIKEVVGAQVIDGKLYIDVIEEEPEVVLDRVGYGPCPSPYKYVSKKITRAELESIKNKENTDAWIARAVAYALFRNFGPLGDLVQMLPMYNDQIISEMNHALSTNKNSFTMKSRLKCVQGDMGSRGIVHHYEVESITIR